MSWHKLAMSCAVRQAERDKLLHATLSDRACLQDCSSHRYHQLVRLAQVMNGAIYLVPACPLADGVQGKAASVMDALCVSELIKGTHTPDDQCKSFDTMQSKSQCMHRCKVPWATPTPC